MPTVPETFTTEMSLRHALATLAYRAAKAISKAPPGFLEFRAGDGSRSAGEILAHLAELTDWALSQARGEEKWQSLRTNSWEPDALRFFTSLTKLDEYLASGAPLYVAPEKLFQGAIADSLTHVGQLAMLRRLAGAPLRGENYFRARIETGHTGMEQAPPVREFD
jgi:hypothetical protein